MALTGVSEAEVTAWEELLFTLHDRDHPTVIFMECDSLPRQSELETQLQQDLPEYQFHSIDLTPYPVTSLLRALAEQLPTEIQQSPPVRYVVNVHGLENSLIVTEDGELKHSLLTAQLNLERELLFRNVPYIIVVWSDGVFFRKLQREAPDLWDWVTAKFQFSDLAVRSIVDIDSATLPKNTTTQSGNKTRIWELKRDNKKVDDELRTSRIKETLRVLKKKLNTISLLAFEYDKANRYSEAESTVHEIIRLQEKLKADNDEIGRSWLTVGTLCVRQQRFADALQAFEQSRKYLSEGSQADRHLLIGHTYGLKGEWEPALENIQLALAVYKRTGNYYRIAKTFRALGLTYAVQRQDHMALETYREALIWQKEAGYTEDLAETSKQIAGVYGAQKRYDDAFYWYQRALALLPVSEQAERQEIQERIAYVQLQAAESVTKTDV